MHVKAFQRLKRILVHDVIKNVIESIRKSLLTINLRNSLSTILELFINFHSIHPKRSNAFRNIHGYVLTGFRIGVPDQGYQIEAIFSQLNSVGLISRFEFIRGSDIRIAIGVKLQELITPINEHYQIQYQLDCAAELRRELVVPLEEEFEALAIVVEFIHKIIISKLY